MAKKLTESYKSAVVFAALGKLASSEGARDALAPGTNSVVLNINATIDGQWWNEQYGGQLTVGHDSTSSNESAVDKTELVAYLLGLLSKKQLAAVCEDLPNQFAAADGAMPEIDEALLQAAEKLLGQLRRRTQTKKRGDVRLTIVTPEKAA